MSALSLANGVPRPVVAADVDADIHGILSFFAAVRLKETREQRGLKLTRMA